VAVSNYAGAVTSDAAMLIFVADTNPPVIVSAISLDGNTVALCFNEALNLSSAEDTFNYTTTNGIDSAVLQPDGRTVIIKLLVPFADTFSIKVEAVADLAGNSVETVVVSGRVLGFVGEDINSPTMPGSHLTCDGSTFVITGSGTPFTGAADQLHFVYSV